MIASNKSKIDVQVGEVGCATSVVLTGTEGSKPNS